LRKLALREHQQVGITIQEVVAHYKAEQGALQLAQQNRQLDRLLRDHAGNTKLTAKIIKRQKGLPAKIAAELEEQFKFSESFQDRPLDVVLREQKKERSELELRLDKEFGIKATYQEILKAFEPEVKNILADMGYATAKELPVPNFLKDTLWKNLASNILPDLCLTYTEKMLGGFDALVPDMQKEIKIYGDHIRERYLRNLPAGAVPDKSTPLVYGVQNLADFLVKEIESRVALQGEEKALEFLERIPDQYWGEKGREAVLGEIYPNRAEIAKWIGKESPELMVIIKARLGESLQQVITAPLLKLSYNFIHHLDNLERKSPEKLFEFVFNAVPLMSDQLQTANNIAKLNHKKFIHEVDPLTMLKAFENMGKLHPAMPGFAEMKALQDEDHYIQQLEKQAERMDRPGGNSRWYENVDRLRDVTNAPEAIRKQLEMGPDYYLREAKTNRQLLEQKIDAKLKQHFYNDFSRYLLKMGGIHGPQDLPGSEEFWNLLGMSKEDSWDLFNDLAPQMLLEGMRSAFAPEKLNGYMANLMQALNRNLTERRQKGEWQPIQVQLPTNRRLEAKVEEMEDRCNQLIKQMERMLPGMLIKELRELPFLEAVPGKVLAESLRDALRQHPLSQLVEDGLVEGLKKLPKNLPKTYQEKYDADRRSIEENARNIDIVRSESEKTVPYFIKQMETSLFDKWKRMHQKVDKWLERTFGKAAVDAKAFIDRIFRTVFITFVMGPVYKGMRWLLSFGIEWYGRRVGRFAELARLSIIGTDEKPNYVNANLMYRLAETFKACYPAPA
ncbi:MAG: hypothetical protein LLG04_13185, partial [Parachlamydia sp.]|nr:hypothetical protein [Parachlamydia sp.]